MFSHADYSDNVMEEHTIKQLSFLKSFGKQPTFIDVQDAYVLLSWKYFTENGLLIRSKKATQIYFHRVKLLLDKLCKRSIQTNTSGSITICSAHCFVAAVSLFYSLQECSFLMNELQNLGYLSKYEFSHWQTIFTCTDAPVDLSSINDSISRRLKILTRFDISLRLGQPN